MADKIINPLPIRLKQARISKGISQKQLGIQLGMEVGSASARMNQYEKGKHTPDYKTLKAMANELGVPVAYFFCESKSTAELLCLLEKMTEDEKAALVHQIKGD
ncbi:helix-turn-helix domain-containing protein [Shewanella oncorhynchi]|uniref:helix-turn-helix domain-containing protein n=1 Tax=Shewanella TaxID=22 RepID=UPI0001530D2E|nr:helix-turn-helix transcriptional regulator [Shewanella baltica]ACK48662.1 transcriptional regulator, XRE family [Shewanella baltica OS223]MCS6119193.1 helix-turn-helix transcriptional regulator [Shewanella baltica]MCS6129520.1 helix-turn-helix transcriptional regulator [Shewanella baltica]MCS6141474.1 helix-turn-helix transcriptional regulator [Shewanella baltica]MCS6147759.1 helix-turn-helix transcriptional regulator [Shewanella baltica]